MGMYYTITSVGYNVMARPLCLPRTKLLSLHEQLCYILGIIPFLSLLVRLVSIRIVDYTQRKQKLIHVVILQTPVGFPPHALKIAYIATHERLGASFSLSNAILVIGFFKCFLPWYYTDRQSIITLAPYSH